MFHVFLLVMMGRISENVTAVALSEIRPKVFLGAHLVITGSISYGFAVMHPPTQSCDFAGTLSYCLSPAPQAAAGAASAFLFQPKRLERDILINLHLFRQTAFPVCNAIVTFCSSEKKVRTVFPEVPLRVEYALSDLGESMRPILKAMEIWGTDYKKSIPD